MTRPETTCITAGQGIATWHRKWESDPPTYQVLK